MNRTLSIFYWLMKRDILIFLRNYRGYLLNMAIWVLLDIGVFAYLMPYFGLSTNFGTFILAGILASTGIFEAMHSATLFVEDLTNDKYITYDLTLPVSSSSVIFIQRACLFMCHIALLNIFVVPFSKIVFWSKIDLLSFSFIKFSIVFMVVQLMFGFFALWLMSFIRSMENVRNLWTRLIFPLWFLGGYQFSWKAMYTMVPMLAYFSLMNPVLYAMEGMRSAVLGSDGSLNFLLCIVALLVFALIFALRGISLLKKRLDSI